ncbi:MLO protein homolog 1-like [Castanea sativa]|uniref:MLO protein homolog 1-like n=1 Tax=Castanea sativa TaxID=21020 RepID=UPI003F64BCD2
MAAAAAGERSLKETPTLAVAFVCAVFVIISILIEHGIHSLGKWFQKRQKKTMNEALEKIKAGQNELTLISLSFLFIVSQIPISKICIPAKAGNIVLPCSKKSYTGSGGKRRKLLWYDEDVTWRRVLAATAGDDYCFKYIFIVFGCHNKVALVSQSGLHQLHIFIFVVAVFHVLYSVITIVLARAKMKKWKAWEAETTSLEYQFTNDPSRFRLAHQTSFVQRHSGLSTTPALRWIVAFFRQFVGSVTKVDYLTMRHGFINAHLSPNSKFDFHKYIKRSMEDDFKVVVGISIPLSTCIIFLLLNVYGWYTLSWISFMPLAILLLVGTKLEVIIMEMAQQIQDRTTVVKGAPVVEPSNKYFWFNQPDWILFLIHLNLFQNAFQMAYFLWIWYEFGLTSCFHEKLPEILIRVFLGVALQFLCSYVTFPLYSLVTQMGSHMKKAIFEEQTAKAIKKWQKAARERKKLRKAGVTDVSSSGFMSGENTPSHNSSPIHLLHKYKINSNDIGSVPSSPKAYHSEIELSKIEGPARPSSSDDRETRRAETHHTDFSFF